MSNLGRTASGHFTYKPDFSALHIPGDLAEVMRELKSILGADGYYTWACTLPNSVVLNPKRYQAAIEAKLVEVAHPDQSCSKHSNESGEAHE